VRFSRALTTLLRFRHPLLWLWLGFMLARNGPGRGIDWSAFFYGSQLLFGEHADGFTEPGGLHVFANYPWLHMGPVGLLVAAFFRLTFADGRFAAMLAMAALGPVLILVVERAAARARGLRDALDEPLLAFVTLVSGAAFLRGWVNASWTYIHLEEGLVIAGTAVTVWCVVTRRATLAGAAVGLSIASKLSGVLLFPLLACFSRRLALRAGAVAVGFAAVAWLPFFVADLGTFDAGKGTVGNFPASGLHLLGIDSTGTPEWVRPTQVGLGLVLGSLAVWRRRWEGAVLVAVAARLALDPSTSSYYTAGLAFAALVWDLAGRRPFPLWAPLIVATHVLVPKLGAGPDVEGAARLAVAAAAILTVLALPWARPLGTREPRAMNV
jgi:hypothetical protein